MATANAQGPSKTAFVRDFIRKNPTANRKVVEEAWLAAGHEGPISSSLVSNLRAQLGLTGKKPGGFPPTSGLEASGSIQVAKSKPKKRRRRAKTRVSDVNAAPAPERKPRTGAGEKLLAEIEGDIDRLIFKLTLAGGMESVEAALRDVRRLLYHAHQA